MTRSRIVFLVWVAIGLGAIGTGRELLYNLWYLLTALLILSFLWAWTGIQWVDVERHTRTSRSQVGKMAEERLVVRNRSIIPKLWVEVRDESTLPNHYVSRVVSPLGARKTYAWTLQTRCVQRGRFRLGPLTVSSGDPFGLFQRTRDLVEPRPSTIIVYPPTVDLVSFAPLIGVLPGGDTMRRRTPYVTTNVSGVRDYAPGDSFNRIHWPSSARTGRLISKEFELDPTADVWLFLDLERGAQAELSWAGRPGLGQPRLPWETGPDLILPPSTAEYSIAIAASLARHFIEQDRGVGFITYSQQRQVLPADRGERQLAKVLETLSVLQPDGRIPISEIVAAEGAHLSRNTTAVVITPTDQDYWISAARDLSRRGINVVAVLLESHSFGHPRTNEDLVTELSISGILTYLVREGDDLAEALAMPYAHGLRLAPSTQPVAPPRGKD
ncbi:MAG: DUF58 domain-containing protein [Anaerolineae bacterium]|nr:DUF58 domain-containing protein [Anaerolineae bacterium]